MDKPIEKDELIATNDRQRALGVWSIEGQPLKDNNGREESN